MQEIHNALINDTSNLLEELIPVLSRNIQMLHNDLDPQDSVLQYLLQQEIEMQEKLLQRTKELKEKVNHHLEPEPIDISTNPSAGDLTVIMPDEQQICRHQVSKTFVEVIEKIGIEKVKTLNMEYCRIPIVDTFNHPKYSQAASGDYFIMTHSNTDKKIQQLEEIKDRLNISIEVIDNRKGSL